MKINFDGRQDYQLEAIHAVTDLFTGQLNVEGRIEVADPSGRMYDTIAFRNELTLSDSQVNSSLFLEVPLLRFPMLLAPYREV
jgi:hypothetical protein